METIDVLLDWKPLGQKVLEAGYRVVNENDIDEILERDKMLKAHFDRTLAKEKPKREGFKCITSYRDSNAGKWGYYIYFEKYCGRTRTWAQFKAESQKESCNLDYYLFKIPEKALADIRKAKQIGLDKFQVYWCTIDYEKCEDPIITAKFGNNELFITKW